MGLAIADGAMAQDLLAVSRISESHGAVVVMEGKTERRDDTIRCGVPVKVLQAIYGG